MRDVDSGIGIDNGSSDGIIRRVTLERAMGRESEGDGIAIGFDNDGGSLSSRILIEDCRISECATVPAPANGQFQLSLSLDDPRHLFRLMAQ